MSIVWCVGTCECSQPFSPTYLQAVRCEWTPQLGKQPAGRRAAGILAAVKLENFMCHQNFEIAFGSNINFVSGQNGSGKSAIVQGL